jgi:SAM-dependent methyltransferase
MLDWLEKHFLPQLGPEPVSFLSIGAGTGIFDVPILQQLLRRNLHVRYEGIDPNQDVLRLLGESLRPLACRNLKASISLSGFESYSSQEKFNFILLVHTHYFFYDLRKNLQKAWNLVEDGGNIVLYSALDVFLSQFFKVTFQNNYGHPPWLSHQVQEALTALNIPFRREPIRATLDVSGCFCDDQNTVNDLLSFIVHADASQTPGKDFLVVCLKQNAKLEDGRYLVSHPVDVFVIGEKSMPTTQPR